MISVCCSGDFPDSMKHLIGVELLTALSSGLSYDSDIPNIHGDFLPTWLYFDKWIPHLSSSQSHAHSASVLSNVASIRLLQQQSVSYAGSQICLNLCAQEGQSVYQQLYLQLPAVQASESQSHPAAKFGQSASGPQLLPFPGQHSLCFYHCHRLPVALPAKFVMQLWAMLRVHLIVSRCRVKLDFGYHLPHALCPMQVPGNL